MSFHHQSFALAHSPRTDSEQLIGIILETTYSLEQSVMLHESSIDEMIMAYTLLRNEFTNFLYTRTELGLTFEECCFYLFDLFENVGINEASTARLVAGVQIESALDLLWHGLIRFLWQIDSFLQQVDSLPHEIHINILGESTIFYWLDEVFSAFNIAEVTLYNSADYFFIGMELLPTIQNHIAFLSEQSSNNTYLIIYELETTNDEYIVVTEYDNSSIFSQIRERLSFIPLLVSVVTILVVAVSIVTIFVRTNLYKKL